MRTICNISIVGCHAEGEVGDVIIGGVADAPVGMCKTMHDKLVYFATKRDHTRKLLLNEPRGRSSMNTNLLVQPCDSRAAAGLLILESTEWAPMSGSNIICTSTVLLETGIIPMTEPVTRFSIDTAAGLVGITADCDGGKCRAVSFDNVPAFVWLLDAAVDVPDYGIVKVDIAWGGAWFALVDVASCGLRITDEYATQLVELGERIKRAVQAQIVPFHPENPKMRGVEGFEWTSPPSYDAKNNIKLATNTVVVSPGRFDRSPCGTGSCARMAVMHARGELKEDEVFRHLSFIGSSFVCKIRGSTMVGQYAAILPSVKGRAWITGMKQIMLDPDDPFPEGFQVGDQWHISK